MGNCGTQKTSKDSAYQVLLDQKSKEYYDNEANAQQEIYIPNLEQGIEFKFSKENQYINQPQTSNLQLEEETFKAIENQFFSKNNDFRIFVVEGDTGLGKSSLLKQIEYYCWKTLATSKPRIYPIRYNALQSLQSASINLCSFILEDNGYQFNGNQLKEIEKDLIQKKIKFVILVDNCEKIYKDQIFQQLLEQSDYYNFKIILTLNPTLQVYPFYNFLSQNNLRVMKVQLKCFQDYEILKYIKLHQNIYEINMMQCEQNDFLESFKNLFLLQFEIIEENGNFSQFEQMLIHIFSRNSEAHTGYEGMPKALLINIKRRILHIKFLFDFASYPSCMKLISVILMNLKTQKINTESFTDYLDLLIKLIKQRKNGKGATIKKTLQYYRISNIIQSQITSNNKNSCETLSQSSLMKDIIKIQQIFKIKNISYISQYTKNNLVITLCFSGVLDQLSNIKTTYIYDKEFEKLKKMKGNAIIRFINFASDNFKQIPSILENIYQNNQLLIMKLIKLVKASAVIDKFNQLAGNALTLLNFISPFIQDQDFSKVRIKNSKMNQIQFYQCNFQNSVMKNVDISSTKFLECNLKYISWNKVDMTTQILQVYRNLQNFEKSPFYFSIDSKNIIFQDKKYVILLRISDQKQILKKKQLQYFFLISPDHRFLAVYHEPFVKIYRFTTGILIRKIYYGYQKQQFCDCRECFQFSKNAEFLITHVAGFDCLNFKVGGKFPIESHRYDYSHFDSMALKLTEPVLAFITNKYYLNVWDLFQRKQIKRFQLPFYCRGIFFSSNGQTCAVLSFEKIMLWNSEIWQQIQTIDVQEKFYSVAITNDLKQLAISKLRMVKILNLEDGNFFYLKNEENIIRTPYCVHNLVFSPNEKILATISDQKIKIQDVQDFYKLTYSDNILSISQIDISEDGQFIASSSHDGSIRLWNTKVGRLVQRFQIDSFAMESVRFSPNGNSIVGGNSKGKIYIWDLISNVSEYVLEHNKSIANLEFSPDGETLISSSDDHMIIFYNLKNKKQTKIFASLYRACFACSSNFQIFAYVLDINTIQLLDAQLDYEKIIIQIKGWFGDLNVLAFSKDSKILFAGGKVLELWKANNGQKICNLEGHKDKIVAIACSMNNVFFVTGSLDETIILRGFQYYEIIQIIEGYSGKPNSLLFSLDGYFLVFGAFDITIRMQGILQGYQKTLIYNNLNLDNPQKHNLQNNNQQEINVKQPNFVCKKFIQIAQSKSYFAFIFQNDLVQLWNLQSKQKILAFKSHSQNFLSIAISKFGNFFAFTEGNTIILMRGLGDGFMSMVKQRIEGHRALIRSLCFTPNESLLASGDNDCVIYIWHVQSGILIKSLKEHIDLIYVVSFSEDGKFLVSYSKDKTIRLWNTELNFSHKPQVLQIDSEITAFQFSPNSQFLALGYLNGTVQIFQFCVQQSILQFQGHLNQIYSIDFSYDGELLISVGDDFKIKLWKLSDGQLIRSIYNQEEPVLAVAFVKSELQIIYITSYGNIKKENVYPSHHKQFGLYLMLGDMQFRCLSCQSQNSHFYSKDDVNLQSLLL